MSFKLNSYPQLRANKAKLNAAFDATGMPPHLRRLFLAMGMLETTTLSSADRDVSKDKQGLAANVTLWNLSIDLVQQLGYKGDPWQLNKTEKLPEVVSLLRSGVETWGRDRLLAFVRGGRTAFRDGCSYGCREYLATIATIERALSRDPALAWDDRRVDIHLRHV